MGWWLFYVDTQLSNKNHLREVEVAQPVMTDSGSRTQTRRRTFSRKACAICFIAGVFFKAISVRPRIALIGLALNLPIGIALCWNMKEGLGLRVGCRLIIAYQRSQKSK